MRTTSLVFAKAAAAMTFFFAITTLTTNVQAFSASPQPARVFTREGFFQKVVSSATTAAVVVTTTTMTPTVAHADAVVDAAIASAQLAAPAALRALKRSRKKLTALELVVSDNDYGAFKNALRADPISDLRKSCSTMIQAAQGKGDEETSAQLLSAYKLMTKNLETTDGMASLAMRGKQLKEGEFFASFAVLEESLDAFMKLAETVVDVPEL